MDITVLRLGHRLPRDERISTHVALVARAFGAGSLIYSGQHDEGMEKSVSEMVANWGGNFTVQYEKNYKKAIAKHREEGFLVVHLSMYSMPLPEKLGHLQKQGKLLVVVGGEAVPPEMYELADYNIAVTSQPHSEVAALAVLLDRLMQGKELGRDFDGGFRGRVRIEPSERGKKVGRG